MAENEYINGKKKEIAQLTKALSRVTFWEIIAKISHNIPGKLLSGMPLKSDKMEKNNGDTAQLFIINNCAILLF